MSMPLQFFCIWTQQARSAGVICAFGRVHAIAGASDQTSSNTTAPNSRKRFTAISAYSTKLAGFTSEGPSLRD